MAIATVMLVCIGNNCRSPMAEGLLRQQLPGLRVYSAGVGAMVGMPASNDSVELLKGVGVDISAHRAQQINAFLTQSANLILTAELAQKQHIERQYPQSRGRVFRICEQLRQDIPDPYRRDLSQYEESLALIQQGIADWTLKIQKINQI